MSTVSRPEGERLAERSRVWCPRAPERIEGLSFRCLWGSDVAAVCWLDLDSAADEKARRALAQALRALGDLYSRHGHPLPIVGLVTGVDEGIVKKWAGDQDWHRGDFALEHWLSDCPEAEERLEEILSAYLGGISRSLGVLPQLQPRSREVYIGNIRFAAESRSLSEIHASLVEAIIRAIEHGCGIDSWLREIQERSQQAE
jgi:hypothetical protein